MKTRILLTNSLLKRVCLSVALLVGASSISSIAEGEILSNAPAYDWWYGCSPTSAGMMMGYYDINGYAGLRYDNLVPGGSAELDTFGNPGALANQVIASSGHITDFYGEGNSASGDDVAPPYHSFNSLADFMGTSQDVVGNPNGGTTIYNFNNGSPLYYYQMPSFGTTSSGWSYADASGMYGIYEYVTFAGYGVSTLYNQYTDNLGLSDGFTLVDFQNEIDNNRVVLLHVTGHTMFGYGYEGDTIYFHDTWDADSHSMTWGTSYLDMDIYGVTVMELTGGTPVPEPGASILLGAGLLGFAVSRRKASNG
ncbi:PEP-CTERM sorting domain-containing protein [Chlorobaculum sp. 24CR]|uniref:PEP-CTERM sorting domain-containing protein n=1 Tax=Chlorobaculum sp. 24CR TaxID=2508878 RepID=UPI00100BC09A|nr:PEP-CTERM sorting domain-containing protein [Chlorobaculum sp. 24CR]RXK84599.1 PEP-CTERM sorting domain-containing protein [Chlorobaculum sp. 24CR]